MLLSIEATGTSDPSKGASVVFGLERNAKMHYPHNDLLAITAVIGNQNVHRILVDNRSSIDVIYSKALEQLGLQRLELQPCATPLYNFTGDCVVPEGTILIPIMIGEKSFRASTMMTFVVIMKPTLNALKAVISSYHLKINFPAEKAEYQKAALKIQ